MSKAVTAVIGIALIAAGPLGWAAFSSTGALVWGATGAALGTFVTNVGAALILGLAAQALTPGAPRSSPLSAGIGISYSGTLEPRRIIYGQMKVSGMNALPPRTTGANNDFFHQVLVIAGHPVNIITDVWFGEMRIPSQYIQGITGSSNDGLLWTIPDNLPSHGYNGFAWVRRYYGTQSSVDWILNQALTSWDSSHVGYNIAYLALQFKFDTDVFSSGLPNVTCMVQGKKIYDPRQDDTNGGSGQQRRTGPNLNWTYSTNPALCLRDYLTSSLGLGEDQNRINDTLVAAAANKCDETVSVPLPVLVGLTSWTQGSNKVYGAASAFGSVLAANNFVRGPNGTMYQVSAVNSDIELTLTTPYPGATLASQVTQWNTSSATTKTQKRFTCNTVLDATGRFEDNIAMLCSAMQGHCLYSGGKWLIYAGGWSGAAFSLSEDDLVGGVTVQCTTPRKDLYNSVRGSFIDPQQNYQPAEFPAVINNTYVTEDGGETIYLETSFPCCADMYEAQRNAIVLSRQSRNHRTVTAQFGMSAFRVRPWETGIVTIAEVGWINQTVRCMGWKFNPQGVIDLTLQEAYSADYTDPLVGDYSITGVTAASLPQHYLPYPPTGLVATSFPGAIEFKVTLPDQVLPGTKIELWEGAAASPFSSATLLATGTLDRFAIEKSDATQRYYWVRTRSPTSTQVSTTYPATNGLGAAAAPVTAVGWATLGGCEMDPGDTVAVKTSGSDTLFDAAVYSVTGYTSAHISAKAPTDYATHRFMVGFSTNPAGSPNYPNMNYGLYNNYGTLVVYEAGSPVGNYGTVNSKDVLTVIYDASRIYYFKNGVELGLGARGTGGLTLYGFITFCELQTRVNTIRFGPSTVVSVADAAQINTGAVGSTHIQDAAVQNPHIDTDAVHTVNVQANAITVKARGYGSGSAGTAAGHDPPPASPPYSVPVTLTIASTGGTTIVWFCLPWTIRSDVIAPPDMTAGIYVDGTQEDSVSLNADQRDALQGGYLRFTGVLSMVLSVGNHTVQFRIVAPAGNSAIVIWDFAVIVTTELKR